LNLPTLAAAPKQRKRSLALSIGGSGLSFGLIRQPATKFIGFLEPGFYNQPMPGLIYS